MAKVIITKKLPIAAGSDVMYHENWPNSRLIPGKRLSLTGRAANAEINQVAARGFIPKAMRLCL
jgi:hypothetical protein